MFIANSCGNDDKDPIEEVDALVGEYKFDSAVLTQELGIPGVFTLPAGSDMSAFVEAALFGGSPCIDNSNIRLDMRETNELYYVCNGEAGELKVGTWSLAADRSQLVLNLSSPPLPANLPVTLKNLDESATGIKGDIENLPLPKELFAGFLPPGVDISMLPPAIPVNITIEFDKMN
jgi:hypothetical protein